MWAQIVQMVHDDSFLPLHVPLAPEQENARRTSKCSFPASLPAFLSLVHLVLMSRRALPD